jgi:hypothetical protein
MWLDEENSKWVRRGTEPHVVLIPVLLLTYIQLIFITHFFPNTKFGVNKSEFK